MTKNQSWITPDRAVMFLKSLALAYSSYYRFSYTSTCQTTNWLYFLWIFLIFEVFFGFLSEFMTTLSEISKQLVYTVQIMEFIWQWWGVYLVMTADCKDEMQQGIHTLLLCFVGSTLVLVLGIILNLIK